MTLDKLPSYLALATFLMITLVVSHEWGYFNIIGNDFQSLYTTYDYIALFIVWIGPVFILLVCIIGTDLFLRRALNFEIKLHAKSRWGKIFEEHFFLILFGLITPFILLLTDQTQRFTVYLLLALICFRIIWYVLSYKEFAEFRKSPAAFLLVILAPAMIVSYGIGRDGAYHDLKDTNEFYELQLKDQATSRNVKVLRLLEKGAIIFDPIARSVDFYRQDNIAYLRKQAPDWDTKSFACEHFGWGCNSKVINYLLTAPGR